MKTPQHVTKISVPQPTKLFVGLYILLAISLFLYSFTQIDLGLTLTRASFFATIQHAFQYIGYFNRSLSAVLFSVILILLFFFYVIFLLFAKRDLITKKTVWVTVFLITAILTLSYTAFSYDIFNYVFDAKIVTQYNENPYFKKALDYPNDPMLSFMHWTHRTYPYGPTWLIATVPLSFLGLQYFLPTYFLFKLLAAGAYLGSVFAISRIMRVVAPKYELQAMVLFAFNPLVIIESLVSGHNDIVMMFLCLLAILLLVKKHYLVSLVVLFLSIGIKYATGFLLPLFVAIALFDRKKIPIKWEQIFITFLVAMIFALVAAVLRSTFQPWYLLFILPFAALTPRKPYIVIPTIVLSFAAVVNYLPYLYTGNWDKPIPEILLTLNVSAVVLSVLITIGYELLRRKKRLT